MNKLKTQGIAEESSRTPRATHYILFIASLTVWMHIVSSAFEIVCTVPAVNFRVAALSKMSYGTRSLALSRSSIAPSLRFRPIALCLKIAVPIFVQLYNTNWLLLFCIPCSLVLRFATQLFPESAIGGKLVDTFWHHPSDIFQRWEPKPLWPNILVGFLSRCRSAICLWVFLRVHLVISRVLQNTPCQLW